MQVLKGHGIAQTVSPKENKCKVLTVGYGTPIQGYATAVNVERVGLRKDYICIKEFLLMLVLNFKRAVCTSTAD